MTWLDEIKVTKNRGSRCRGRFFRFGESIFVSSHGSVEVRKSFRLLKKMSCPGCDECRQFDEDLSVCDVDEVIELPDKPVHGKIYELKFVPGVRDWETGILEEWHWTLVKIDE
jgi:hypothetical protein